MADTEAEFTAKDRQYFELVGRTAMVGERAGQIIEYDALPGPEYKFVIQFDNYEELRSLYRDEFYVLPTLQQIETAIRERLATMTFHAELPATLRAQVIDQYADVLAGTVNQLLAGGGS